MSHWIADFGADLRFGVRQLRRAPAHSLLAVLTLALGIGATAAVYTVADALLLRPPPFDRAERIYWIWDLNAEMGVTIDAGVGGSPGNFIDWREKSRSFDHMVAWQNWFFSVADPGRKNLVAEQIRGVHVSPSFFSMLGVTARLGRTFLPEEEEPGRDRVVMLAHGLWQRRYGADPDIIGTTVLIDGRPFSVIGVLPATFSFLQPDFEMWMPMTVDGAFRTERASHSVAVLARIAPGTTEQEAQADIDRLTRALQQAYPDTNAGWTAGLRRAFPLNRDLRPTVSLLLGAVLCLLLIACVNVANLLLIRVGGRQREIAVRASIGASRARLIRQLLTESALLAGLGTAGGLFIAVWSLQVLQPLLPRVQVTRPLGLHIDLHVLLFVIPIAVLTALIFGTAPALRAGRTADLRSQSSTSRRTMLGRVLSAAEIAASLMLVIGAMLLVRSLWNLQRVDPGFQPDRLVTMQMWLPAARYPDRFAVSSFYEEVLRRLQGFPELRAAALVNTRPFLGWSLGARLEIPGQPLPSGREAPIVGCRVISPGYLTALGTPLLKGRSLTEMDGRNGAAVAVVNEALVERYWPNDDPIGKPIRVASLGSTSGAPWWPEQMTETFTIVGVAGNVRESRLKDQVEPVVYLSYLQNPSRFMHVMVRTESAAAGVLNLVQREIRAVDADLGVYDARTMDAVLDQVLAEPKFNSILLWIFATAALVLSAVGVYGVTSSAVAERSREFAIRIALGAGRGSIFQLVTHDGMFIALTGIGVGLTGALLLARALSGLLYGVVATDRITFAGGAAVVLAVALAASWPPAWRATRVDPMSVLRAE